MKYEKFMISYTPENGVSPWAFLRLPTYIKLRKHPHMWKKSIFFTLTETRQPVAKMLRQLVLKMAVYWLREWPRRNLVQNYQKPQTPFPNSMLFIYVLQVHWYCIASNTAKGIGVARYCRSIMTQICQQSQTETLILYTLLHTPPTWTNNN